MKKVISLVAVVGMIACFSCKSNPTPVVAEEEVVVIEEVTENGEVAAEEVIVEEAE